ncbi:MAG: heme A synthase [Elainellaceae cyanobacterium]
MTDSALHTQSSVGHLVSELTQDSGYLESENQAKTQIRRLIWKMAIATFILMAIGSATRVMNAGLACPDWPLCYGTLYPAQQMNLRVFLEWFHRLDAAVIGFMAIVLVGASWWHRRTLPRWMPLASVGVLGLIGFQGVLGGLTVTQMLRFDIVTAHLGTALLFFMALLVVGILLLPATHVVPGVANRAVENRAVDTKAAKGMAAMTESPRDEMRPALQNIHWVSLGAAIVIYGQSLTGALVGSRWALHQCLNLESLCTVMNSHLIGVVPASLASLAVVVMAWRNAALPSRLRRLAWVVAGLLTTQILLGVGTFKLHLQVELLTVTHQAVGAALLGTLLSLAVVGFRVQRLQADSA